MLKKLKMAWQRLTGEQVVVSGGAVAKWLGPTRMYDSARPSRLTSGWGNLVTSADNEIKQSLRTLRSRSRQLCRDSSYAKRAKTITVNNIIGGGIGLQAQVMTSRGTLNERINGNIEAGWERWSRAENCHTGGTLHFADLERLAMDQVFEAGEVFIRKHYRPFGPMGVPLTLELIESERVIDEFEPSGYGQYSKTRMGIELDQFFKPLAYYLRKAHPGDVPTEPWTTDYIERVPAEQIIHLRLIDRWPQTRGVPWLHTAMKRLNDMDGLSEAEITAARGAASYMAIIESPEGFEEAPDENIVIEPGIVQRVNPGEKFNFVNPQRPNAQLDPFMRLMLREVAAGCGVSYESLSRDYSQSNYSSSRLALIDDRDLFRMLQRWFIRSFREPLHREWMQAGALAGAIEGVAAQAFYMNVEKVTAARFKPRGWSWVDPTKEVDAYKEAVKAGFMTNTEVISLTGGGNDIEDVLTERRRELDMMEEKDLEFDTDPTLEQKQTPAAPAKAVEMPDEEMQQQGGNNGNGKN